MLNIVKKCFMEKKFDFLKEAKATAATSPTVITHGALG